MGVRDLCFKVYWGLEKRIAPGLRYSQDVYEEFLSRAIKDGSAWLDVGCGHSILPSWRNDQEQSLARRPALLVGLDPDIPALARHISITERIAGDVSALPFDNEVFDIVTSNMVFEHLEDPMLQLREINRVLKPNGILLFHTPNFLGYSTQIARLIPESLKSKIIEILQGRPEEDVYPAFYRINKMSDIERYASESGFEVLGVDRIASSAQTVVMPPLVVFELLWIRATMTSALEPLRTNIIAKLEKRADS